MRSRRLIEFSALQAGPALAVGALIATHLQLPAEAVVAAGVTLAVGSLLGRSPYSAHLLTFARVFLRAVAPVVGAIAAGCFALLDGNGLNIGGLSLAVLGSWIVLASGFWIERSFEGGRVRVAVLSGSDGMTGALSEELRVAGIRSHEVIGWIAAESQGIPEGLLAGGHRYLGHVQDIREVILDHRVDLLVNCPVRGGESADLDTLESIAEGCLDLPVRFLQLNQLYESLLGHVPLGTTDASWFQHILNPGFDSGSPRAARLTDFLIASFALLVAAPLLVAAAIAIKLSDRGPVLYRQRRVGKNGAEFTMLKLRSMPVNSETVGAAKRSWQGDDRATPVGRWLRLLHLDELPQIWNVLKGEMSLVGPRPERPGLVAQLEAQFPFYKCRHLVKPGITGWGQVRCGYAGSDTGVAWKLCHDLFYLKHRSTLSDLLIMMETIRTVAAGAQHGLRAPDGHFLAEGTPSTIVKTAAPVS